MAIDYKKLAVLSHIAYSFPAAVFAGAFLGWLVDRLAGTTPFFVAVGFLLGMAGGFWNVFRLLSSIKEKD